MERYKQLMQELYIELKNKETLGSFFQANEMIDGVEAQSILKKAKVKRKQTHKTINRQKDIHHFFKKQGIITIRSLSTPCYKLCKCKEESIVVILIILKMKI